MSNANANARLARLIQAARELVGQEHPWLLRTYGTGARAVGYWWYHNADHGLDVALAAAQLARELIAQGKLPPEAEPLALIAGIYHDHIQKAGPGRNEQLSSVAAVRAMRQYNARHGEVFLAEDFALVRKMIRATRVSGVHGGDLQQMASPSDPHEALMADADLSSLGLANGVYQDLLLFVEQQKRTDPAETLRDPALREKLIGHLRFKVVLFRTHRWLLPSISPRLFPLQAENANALQRLHDAASRGNWGDELGDAQRRGGARPAPPGSVPPPATGGGQTPPSGGGASAGGPSAEAIRATLARAIESANEAIGALALAAEKLAEAEIALGEAVEGSNELEAAQALELVVQAKQAAEETQARIGTAIATAERYAAGL